MFHFLKLSDTECDFISNVHQIFKAIMGPIIRPEDWYTTLDCSNKVPIETADVAYNSGPLMTCLKADLPV